MYKKILSFVLKASAFVLFIVFIQVVYYLVFYNKVNKQINKYDFVIVFPNEIERIEEGVRLAQKSSKKQFSIAGVTDGEYIRLVEKGLIPDDLKFINSGLSHTTIRDILCLKQISRDMDRIIVVTSRYHAPRVKLLLRLMLFKNYKNISIYTVNNNFKNKTAFFYEMCSELKKMWGSIGELVIYLITGSVNEEFTTVRKISNFTKNLMLLK